MEDEGERRKEEVALYRSSKFHNTFNLQDFMFIRTRRQCISPCQSEKAMAIGSDGVQDPYFFFFLTVRLYRIIGKVVGFF